MTLLETRKFETSNFKKKFKKSNAATLLFYGYFFIAIFLATL